MPDRTSELRAALHRADGPAVVAALTGGGLTDDMLHLAGGALPVAGRSRGPWFEKGPPRGPRPARV